MKYSEMFVGGYQEAVDYFCGQSPKGFTPVKTMKLLSILEYLSAAIVPALVGGM
jgi:hypothetical protein